MTLLRGRHRCNFCFHHLFIDELALSGSLTKSVDYIVPSSVDLEVIFMSFSSSRRALLLGS